MSESITLWVEYILRFSHLVAGIAWIGSSFYFIWLDSSFESPKVARRNVDGELYMVHGGFYYLVEKRKLYPGELPETLHWFKWEATLTWITGVLLMVALYYLRGASLLIDTQVKNLSQMQAVGLSVWGILAAWLIYDMLLWNPRVSLPKSVSSILSVLFFGGLIYLNTRLFSGRGAFIQTGAIFGTIMLLNVWVRILPGQTKMFKDAEAGRVPDYSAGAKSKIRSVHNTYFTFPVLFIMLSNHFPQVYNHPQNWLLLICLGVSGALVRHAMVTKNPKERWTLAPAAVGLLSLIAMTTAPSPRTPMASVSFVEVNSIMQTRCITCHSTAPTDDIFKVAPKNLILETEAQIRANGGLINQQVYVGRAMPLANKTQITDEERATIHHWLAQEGLIN